ncbi:MAG: O-antigen ligase family protein [Planctomycetes bacterium]|nr:O-antigen ligase family protein [Planctomycetota bacterium]
MQPYQIAPELEREHHHGGISFPVLVFLIYLAGITIFGKGPTYLYLGFKPLYLGEVCMFLMLGWMLWRISITGFFPWLFHLLGLMVLLFIIYNAIRTIPGIFSYQMPALRDAASWYYSAFFFIGLYLASEHRTANWMWKWLVRIWLLAMLYTFSARMSGQYIMRIGPLVRDGSAYLFGGSGSENIQHMVLGGVILLLGLGHKKGRHLRGIRYVIELGLIFFAFFYLFLTTGRGVKIAMLIGLVITIFATFGRRQGLWPASRWFAIAYILILTIGLFAILAGPAGLQKYVYIKGDIEHIEEGLQFKGTANWRFVWWKEIINDLNNKNPFFGLGYGVSLGDYNPYIREGLKSSIRSPHNYNITILGRTGFLGFALWLAILFVGIGQLLWRARCGGIHGRRYTLERNKELAFWSIFLIATWINASFGVLMEGPVLGIWFWFGLGFATGRSLDPHGLESSSPAQEQSISAEFGAQDTWWLRSTSLRQASPHRAPAGPRRLQRY